MVNNNSCRKEEYWLSVVIIGRNAGKRLPALFTSLPDREDFERLYIDSNSEDKSIDIALKQRAKVFLVEKESVYAPGTGRYVGTLEAAGRWILYLDSDMVLRKEFLLFLEKLKVENNLPPKTVGFVGRTCNRYVDHNDHVVAGRDYTVLSASEMGATEKWGKPAGYHGGAVLYLRDAVLKAGNWNPAVYQLEELDLCSRIYAKGGILRAVDLPMVDHYTPFLSKWERLRLNFGPKWQEKKLYGAGQVVTAHLRAGSFFALVRFYPYPFLIFTGLLTVPLFVLQQPLVPLIINLLIIAWISFKKKWYYYLVYLGNLLQIFRGLGRYKPFKPQYKRVE